MPQERRNDARPKRPVGRPRADGRPHIKKEQVLRAATRLFAANGFSATSVRMIAEELGIHPPTIFQLFGDKESILAELHTAIFRTILANYRALAARGESPAATVAALVYSDVMLIVDGDSSQKAIVGLPELRQERFKPLRAQREACVEILEELVTAGVNDGSFAACEPRLAAEQVFVLAETSMHAPFPEKLGSAPAQAEATARFVLRGLLADPGECENALEACKRLAAAV